MACVNGAWLDEQRRSIIGAICRVVADTTSRTYSIYATRTVAVTRVMAATGKRIRGLVARSAHRSHDITRALSPRLRSRIFWGVFGGWTITAESIKPELSTR